MSLIIQKYGGKALAQAEDILQVAKLIYEKHKSGTQLVIVVSAMGDTTDKFLNMARSVNSKAGGRELDVLLSVGERVSIAMLSLALNGLEEGIAESLTGAQAGIITDTVYTAANIVEIRPLRVREVLDMGKIPVIAGYQGITTDKNISTLGRGGTDATAVALAVALGAERVEFMKDVDGVQSADPKLIPVTKILEQLSYEEALEMMGCGAKILQVPAVEMAAEHKVKLAIGNSKTGVAGTIISDRPLLRRTLTAVIVENEIQTYDFNSSLQFAEAVESMRTQGCAPLLANFANERGVILLKKAEAERIQASQTMQKSDGKRALVTLIGPGVGGHGDLAAWVQSRLVPFREEISFLDITESRLSVLLPLPVAYEFVQSVHELCLSPYENYVAAGCV